MRNKIIGALILSFLAVVGIYQFVLPPTDFQDWVKTAPKFHCLVQNEQYDAGFAFFSIASFAKIQDAHSVDVFGVSLETEIIPEEPLLFDLYLHMPKNDKFILYLNKNTIVQGKTIQKLL